MPSATRARRQGDAYQDAVALSKIVDWLAHPERYAYIEVESDEAGYLDDVVIGHTSGRVEAIQVKYHLPPRTTIWTVAILIEPRTGRRGPLPSHIEKWAASMRTLMSRSDDVEGRLITNGLADDQLQQALGTDGRFDLNGITDSVTVSRLTTAAGATTEAAATFFERFIFEFNKPSLGAEEESARLVFFRDLHGSDAGWLSLAAEFRSWVLEPSLLLTPGRITLEECRAAARWTPLSRLNQQFPVPGDFVSPDSRVDERLLGRIRSRVTTVLWAGPGGGKSTYLSKLANSLQDSQTHILRHHYYLPDEAARIRTRLRHERAAESFMAEMALECKSALGSLVNRNPNPTDDLRTWIETCGAYFDARGEVLLIILDGLDHVWREEQSTTEIAELLDHILPLPRGVALIVGTQRLDEALWPQSMTRAVTDADWVELPNLSARALRAWTEANKDMLSGMVAIDLSMEYERKRLAEALYELGSGHPLHLRLTVRAIEERERRVTIDEILLLPGCPHSDVVAYYGELWRRVPDEGQAVLHILAESTFPFPNQAAVVECMVPAVGSPLDVGRGLRAVAHLLARDGFTRLFHNSMYVFIRGTSEHAVYSRTALELANRWLADKAPAYWKWAYSWRLRRRLGDDRPLADGPNRGWVVDSLARGYPPEEVDAILREALLLAFDAGRLPRVVEIQMLGDYATRAFEWDRGEAASTIVQSLLATRADEWLPVVMSDHAEGARTPDLEYLIRLQVREGNAREAERLFSHLRTRWTDVNENDSETWRGIVLPTLRVSAILPDFDVDHLVRWLRQLDFRLPETLEAVAGALRREQRSDRLIAIAERLNAIDRPHVERALVMSALETETAIPSSLLAATTSGYRSLFERMRGLATGGLPDVDAPQWLAQEEYRVYAIRPEMRRTFVDLFFRFLAYHQAGGTGQAQTFVAGLEGNRWVLDVIKSMLIASQEVWDHLSRGDAPDPTAPVNALASMPVPSWTRDRSGAEYLPSVREALRDIWADLTVLAAVMGRRPADATTWRTLFESRFVLWPEWLETVVSLAQENPSAVSPQEMDATLSELTEAAVSLRDVFPERSRRLAIVSLVQAVLTLDSDEARILAADNLVTYGEHKDVLLFSALEAVTACYRAGSEKAADWIRKLAPVVDAVEFLTDGDETGALPGELGGCLVQTETSWIPSYYRHLIERREYVAAEDTLRALAQHGDTSIPWVADLLSTVTDPGTIQLLRERADRGDPGARAVIGDIAIVLGWPYEKTDFEPVRDEPERSGRRASAPINPENYPPDLLARYLEEISQATPYDERIYVTQWLRHWDRPETAEAAYVAAAATLEGAREADHDYLADLALRLGRREAAFRWLVAAQKSRSGWERYYADPHEAEQRWDTIRREFPERIGSFAIESLRPSLGDSAYRWFGSGQGVRLVNYFLLAGDFATAEAIAEVVVDFVVDLVSPFAIEMPDWLETVV